MIDHNESEFNGQLTDFEARIHSKLSDLNPQLLAKSVIYNKTECIIKVICIIIVIPTDVDLYQRKNLYSLYSRSLKLYKQLFIEYLLNKYEESCSIVNCYVYNSSHSTPDS